MHFSVEPFSIARLPRIIFGPKTFAQTVDVVRGLGDRVLCVTGARSFQSGPYWARLRRDFKDAGIEIVLLAIPGEPSPEMVDDAVRAHAGGNFDVVLGIGGGSALDAAKAIAGLLRPRNSVMDHLEGVGPELPYTGPAVPFVAVPTTAGTGSEATKNAVLSRQGHDGFKKSFRDDALVAHTAIVDPDLLVSCPPDVVAANGMDAFTQLLESVVSTRSNPMTEALAWSGMEAFAKGFFPMWESAGVEDAGAEIVAARTGVAYASMNSGICLAQTGLGSVHGLASPLGAFFPIPHGVVCGTLVAEATAENIRALKAREPQNPALKKYARAGEVLSGKAMDGDHALEMLVDTLRTWTNRLALPRLASFGVTQQDIPRIVAASRGSSMKTNPLVLQDREIARVVESRL